MKTRFIAILLIIVLSVPGLASQQSINIGLSLSTSGKYSPMGRMQKKGFNLWKSHVNLKGGIFGKKVQLIIYDDQSNPEKAKKIYQELIEKNKIELVFGPYSSSISEAILPIAEKNGYPVLLSGASADRIWKKDYKYAFGVYTPASKYTVGFLEMLVKNKLQSIAIVSADDSFSISLSNGTQKWAKRFRLNVVYYEQFKKGTKDLKKIALKVKASNCQALLVCGHLDESVNMRNALNDIEWYPKAYYASVGPATQKFHTILKENANLSFSSSQWECSVGIHFPNGNVFIKSFQDNYKISPSYHAATAYAAGMILEEALKRVGHLNRGRLRETLSVMDTMTVIGRYGVDKSGYQIRHFPLIIQWQNGEKKVVWPKKLRETSPIFK